MRSKIEELDRESQLKQTATKILDAMKKLKQNPNEKSPRRWIWELMQNAKDVSYNALPVSIEINYIESEDSGSLDFKHNGQPFSIKNLIYLINQVSGKERGPTRGEVTGKYGTGFLTTHLLSEKVELNSIIEDENEPYKRVQLTLDRSGKTIEEIIQSVEKSRSQLFEIDSADPIIDFSPLEFNTSFKYILDRKGKMVAEKGINDLNTSLSYTLAFLSSINKVHIVHDNIYFEKTSFQNINDIISIHTIKKGDSAYKEDNIEEIKIVVLKGKSTMIAMEIEQKNGHIKLKEISEKTPKLFCDFPLVGSELFPFPVIINSSSFNPTEPRDNISLAEVEDDEEIDENKEIIKQAVDLYRILLKHASKENWGNIHLLAYMPKNFENESIHLEWYKENVLEPIKNEIFNTPIVDTQHNKRISINIDGVYFPSASNNEVRGYIWDLCYQWIPNSLPCKSDIDKWSEIRWLELPRITLNKLTEHIEKIGTLNGLSEAIKPNDPIKWINLYVETIGLEASIQDSIYLKGKYSIFPNQNGVFKNVKNIEIDDNIEGVLITALFMLGVDCKEYLLHKEIKVENSRFKIKTQDNIVFDLNKTLKEKKNDNLISVYYYLASLFSENVNYPTERQMIFNICEKIFPEEFKEKRYINKWTEEIWHEVDKNLVGLIIRSLTNLGNIQKLGEHLKLDNKSTIEWIDKFITFLAKNNYMYLLNQKNCIILPNQNGTFLNIERLFLDDEIDNHLKEISFLLGHDFKEELLEPGILLDLQRKTTEGIVLEKILHLIKPRFSEIKRSKDTKTIFNMLMVWINNNPNKAKEYFSDIPLVKFFDEEDLIESVEKAEKYDRVKGILNKFKIDDKELEEILNTTLNYSSNSENMTEIQNILKKHGIINSKDLDIVLAIQINNKEDSGKEIINEDLLIQLGINSHTELMKNFENKWFSDRFIHTSDSKPYKFDFVQKILNRSKERILAHLKGKPEYNLDGLTEIGETIFLVLKNNEEIYIIAKPSDYGQVLIPHDTEKDVLDYEKDWELWVEDGTYLPPYKLTLGKILKITGINKIPLRKIR